MKIPSVTNYYIYAIYSCNIMPDSYGSQIQIVMLGQSGYVSKHSVQNYTCICFSSYKSNDQLKPEMVIKSLFSTYYVLLDTTKLQTRKIALVKLK